MPAWFPAQAQVISSETIAAALPDYYADAEQQAYIPSVADYDKFDWSLTKVEHIYIISTYNFYLFLTFATKRLCHHRTAYLYDEYNQETFPIHVSDSKRNSGMEHRTLFQLPACSYLDAFTGKKRAINV